MGPFVREKQVLYYHKNGLRDLGYSFSWTKLLGALFLEVMDIIVQSEKDSRKGSRKIIKVARGEQDEEDKVDIRHG